MSGLELARRFYRAVVQPRLVGVEHAAALLGDGSEVLGYDDAVSTDHDFGPRLQVFLPARADPAAVHGALADLPAEFEGFAVVFSDTDRHGGLARHQVEVTTAAEFFAARLGVDPAGGMTLADWLLSPTQRLATLTAGAVFHDPDGVLYRRRAALRWYPTDVWRYVLAAGWLRVGQEEPFVGRAGSRGDGLGSAVLAARLVRDLMRLAFLVERRWAPYGKWLGRAFTDLPLAATVGPHLGAALAASGWRERQGQVCAAASLLAAATNRLGLAAPVDPAARQFHQRDIQVLDAERFTVALTAAVTDPDVAALLDGLGHRAGRAVGALPGAIDQAVDSTDILEHPGRCRAAAPALGLDGRTPL
ncbi:MAG: hypothetical protein V7637_557 [Mycobacteriales bacterium]|jgi:catechol 2,3-dioxygenase-like lactoylglutathione lyase family enzyme